MKCQFCHQDVNEPCLHTADVQQRAEKHVERCEQALRDGGPQGGSDLDSGNRPRG